MRRILTIIIGFSILTSFSYSQTEDKKVENKAVQFVKGISNSKIYTKEQADKGSEYDLNYNSEKVVFYFDQLFVMFYHKTANDKTRIFTEFTVGMESDGEMTWEKNGLIYQIGLHDFDGDRTNELIIAVKDVEEFFSGLELNIFKYSLSEKKWKLIGIAKREDVSGEPTAIIENNTIKIERNFRGFYNEWKLKENKFEVIHND